MIKAAENYILTEIEQKFQDKVGNLFIDTTWTPEEHVTLEGTVITAPVRFASDNYRTVVGTVEKGDRIFFSYGVIFDYALQPDNDTPVYKNLILFEGKEYWRVEAGEVFCKVNKGGSLEMITDNILILPLSANSGVVRAMPKRLKLSCQPGDTVFFESKYIQKYQFLGREHFITPSRRIIAKL